MLEEILTLAKTAGGSESGARFLERVAGPAADEVGLMLQERMRLVRLQRTLRWSARAREMLEDVGLEGGTDIPLRTLFPLLEGASLEEDESLGEMWASLIANAATHDPEAVPTSFPKIMQQLSPDDASVLIATSAPEPDGFHEGRRVSSHHQGLALGDISRELKHLSGEAIELSLWNLRRLALVEALKQEEQENLAPDATRLRVTKSWTKITYRLTTLGKAFLTACRPPQAQNRMTG